MLGWMEHMHDFRVELNAEKSCCLGKSFSPYHTGLYFFHKLFAQFVLHVSIVGHRNYAKKRRYRHPASGSVSLLVD
jgi:hypothetical protein